MSRTRFTGPVTSGKGFRFTTANSGDRGMTITCTTLVRTAGNSPTQSATVTGAMLGGMNKVTAAWGNLRQRTAATLVFVCCRPLNASNSYVLNLISNVGTGNVFEGRSCTVDVFALGYCS
jgi:hypothetical protein